MKSVQQIRIEDFQCKTFKTNTGFVSFFPSSRTSDVNLKSENNKKIF